MGREGDGLFPFLLVVLWDRVTTVLGSASLVTFPGCPCPSVAGVGWWRWGGWWWGEPGTRAQGALPSSYWCILFLMVLRAQVSQSAHQ